MAISRLLDRPWSSSSAAVEAQQTAESCAVDRPTVAGPRSRVRHPHNFSLFAFPFLWGPIRTRTESSSHLRGLWGATVLFTSRDLARNGEQLRVSAEFARRVQVRDVARVAAGSSTHACSLFAPDSLGDPIPRCEQRARNALELSAETRELKVVYNSAVRTVLVYSSDQRPPKCERPRQLG